MTTYLLNRAVQHLNRNDFHVQLHLLFNRVGSVVLHHRGGRLLHGLLLHRLHLRLRGRNLLE